MSGHGAPRIDLGDASDLRVAIVASSWHTEVMDGLIAGAQRAAADAGARTTLIRVPGSFELPVVSKAALEAGALDNGAPGPRPASVWPECPRAAGPGAVLDDRPEDSVGARSAAGAVPCYRCLLPARRRTMDG